MFTGSTHLQNALNDYRQDGQNASQPTGTRQASSTNIEDFPPLGRNGTNDNEPDQRNPFATFSNSNTFSSQQTQTQPPRPNLSTGPDTQAMPGGNRHISPAGFHTTSTNRSPLENGRSGLHGAQDAGRDVRMTDLFMIHLLIFL